MTNATSETVQHLRIRPLTVVPSGKRDDRRGSVPSGKLVRGEPPVPSNTGTIESESIGGNPAAAYVRRNSKSGHQLMQNNYGGMLSLSSG